LKNLQPVAVLALTVAADDKRAKLCLRRQ